MTNKWLNTKRNKSVIEQVKSRRKSRKFGEFEQLEEKRCLAFLGFFDGVSLEITQTTDDGDVVVENSGDIWRATDNAGTFTFVDSTNVEIIMLPDTVNQLDVQIDTEHTGDVTLTLDNGAREVFFTGALNEIGGDLTITSGDDAQSINLGSMLSAPMIVHGDGEIHLGTEFDQLLNEGQLITFDGDVSISGVNEFQYSLMIGLIGPPRVESDLTIDTTVEDLEFMMIPNGGAYVVGDFTFTGGVNIDELDLTPVTVEGDVTIDLGIGEPFFGNPQHVVTGGTIFGDLNIVAGDSNLGNLIELNGVFGGNIVSYTGGDLVDTVTYNMAGVMPGVFQADVFIVLGGGDDEFVLQMPVNQLEVDFGNDPGDVFTNEVDPIDFEVDLTNFHFFNHIYTAVNDQLVMTQIADTGNIIIDNDGGISGFDWQVATDIGVKNSTLSAENLIVNLIANTGNNLDMDLINPVIASIELNLQDGDREVRFVGISNNPLRDINITAGTGVQTVDLAVNHPLGVATLNIDLGTGFDVVNDNDRPLIVDEDLIFSGVNQFEHDGLVSVFRDSTISTTGEVEDSVFAINGTFIVGSEFTFTGGDGADTVRLNGPSGAQITKEAVIDVGDSITGTPQVILVDSAASDFGRSLTVVSSNANTPDEFISDPGTQFHGDLSVDLGGGTNDATMVGIFTGTSVEYIGGSGADVVVYGMTGTAADLSIFLGAGDDQVDLLAGSSISSPLMIDFGPGNDTFNNLFGPFNFDASLLGLQGFNHTFVLASNTLISTQVEDLGNVVFENSHPSESFTVNAGGSISLLAPVDNLEIKMLDGSSVLDVQINRTLDGDLDVDLGNGLRLFNLSGVSNTIGGDLTVTAGSGNQQFVPNVANPLVVNGSALIDLGIGDDDFDTGNSDVFVNGDASFVGVNQLINNFVMTFGGNLLFDVSGETENTLFRDSSPITVAGNFTYIGSDADDSILLAPTTDIGGNISIDAGGGNNVAQLINILGGSQVTYIGTGGVDLVTYGTTGSAATLNISLGDNDDIFTLNAGANIVSPLTVDFGSGEDTFINNFGVFTFDAVLNGLNGFNHTFTLASSTLESTHVEDLGKDVFIDTSGLANSFQFTVEDVGGSTGTSSIAPADNFILTIADGTDTEVFFSVDHALAGDVTVDMGDGYGIFDTTGLGSIGGLLNVDGGSDAQLVTIGIPVAGDIDLSLGDGDNEAFFLVDSGGAFNFTSGDGNDTIFFDATAGAVTANMGAGDDTFRLTNLAGVTSLFVDFGPGADTFTNELGALNFPTTLLGVGGFDHVYDPVAGTLTSIQTEVNGGPVTFDTNGAGDAVRVTAATVSEFGPITSLDVTMLDNSGDNVNFDFDTGLAGDLMVDLGEGVRITNFTGTDNSIGGTLDLLSGGGAQTVNLGINNGLTVASGLSIDLGTGDDTLDANSNDLIVSAGHVDFLNANQITLDGLTDLPGNLNVDSSSESEHSAFDAAMLDLVGEFSYTGGDANDSINLAAAGSIGGDIDIKAGNGNNDAAILGMFGGTSLKYNGGTGGDDVTLGTTGNDANVNVKLGAGNDSFALNAGTAVAESSLRVDFGGGDDEFTSNYGQFDFNAQLLNLDGYNAIFNLVSGNLDIMQVADTGDLTVDNNGAGSSIRFGNGGTMNEISPANDLRVILEGDTSTNVTADFDNVRDGITVFQLRSGDRTVMMTGSSNTFTDLLRFEASDGVQNIHLAVNADLNVDGTLVVNTRDGSDTVTADNSVNVSNAMLLRSVNTLVNNHGIDVGADFNMISFLESENTKLISNASFAVGGNVTYLGGAGVDTINFKSTGAVVDGYIYADIGTASDTSAKQRVILTGGVSATSVVVDGGSSIGGNVFTTDVDANFSGNVIVNFSASTTTNTVTFRGNYGSTYGTYRGGSSSDYVVVGANAPSMLFAVLTIGGNDQLVVEATTNVDFLYGDMGGGTDAVDNQFAGDFPFDNNIFNL